MAWTTAGVSGKLPGIEQNCDIEFANSPSSLPFFIAGSATMADKQELFGIKIDNVDMQGAVSMVRSWIEEGSCGGPCRVIVTPNVDHTVLLEENEGLRDAYRNASLVLADGHPIVWASRLLGKALPERVPGSELVPRLFDSFDQQGELKVFLLGAAEGVGAKAAQNMARQWPNVKVVGVYSPPMGFEKKPEESEIILEKVNEVQPDLIVLGLGAPKQEIWANQYRERLDATTILCVGATIDFLAGEQHRAPEWIQNCGMEWFHRMCTNPKRLVKRYAKDAWVFPQLVVRQFFGWKNRAV